MIASQTTTNSVKRSETLSGSRSAVKSVFGLGRVLMLSTTFWLIIFLIAIDLFITNVRPMRFVKIPGVILQDQDPIVEEVSLLRSASNDANVLLLGTSLLRNVTAFADAKVDNRKLTVDGWNRYFKAKKLDNLLQKQFGLDARCLNIFVGGGFFYDSWLLLKIATESKNPPKYVILTVAPKDFLDNTRPLEDSHVQISLNSRIKDSTKIKDLPTAVDWLGGNTWQYYRRRGEYRSVLETLVCSVFDRAPSIYAALHEKVVKRTSVKFSLVDEELPLNKKLVPEKAQALITYYKTVYESTTDKTLLQEMRYFSDALALLKQKNIQCLVVGMPLSGVNERILPAHTAKKYSDLLLRVCNESGVEMINMMNDKRFLEEDFDDVVHLNGNGSLKFWRILGKEMENNKTISAQLVQSLKKRGAEN